jgi:RNA polymerase sigma factor (sigma-70 family)
MSSTNNAKSILSPGLVAFCEERIRNCVQYSRVGRDLREDVVQESWLELLRSLGSFNGWDDDVALRAWIRKIVRSKAVDATRRQLRERNCRASEYLLGNAEARDTEREPEAHETAEHIGQVLDEIRSRATATTWRAVELCLIDGSAPRDAAAKIGITPHQVSKRLTKVRSVFRVMWRRSIKPPRLRNSDQFWSLSKIVRGRFCVTNGL